ncbi:hypothetical protein ACVIGA_003560 [Bradyrhizobium sp. USDA 3240]
MLIVRDTSAWAAYSSEVSAPLRHPPPLWGRVGRGVSRERARTTSSEIVPDHSQHHARVSEAFRLAAELAAPLSPTLPHKGGGSPTSLAVALDTARSAPC